MTDSHTPGRSLYARPLFLGLLPLFALWHSFNEFFGLIRLSDALAFLLYAGIWGLLLYGLCRLIFRDALRAAAVSLFLLAVFLLFGNLYDLVLKYGHARLVTYKLFPLLLLSAAVWAGLLCARRERAGKRSFRFLNLLLATLLLAEGITSVLHYLDYRRHRNLIQPGTTLSDAYRPGPPSEERPDIYLLVLDEYARADVLRKTGFDNEPFLDSLRGLGFFVADSSRANYNFTPYAMSSCLNMDYINPALGTNGTDTRLMMRAVRSLADNETMRILRKEGYDLQVCASLENPWQRQPTVNEFGGYSYLKLFKPTLPFRFHRDIRLPADPLLRLFPQPVNYNDYAQRARDIQAHLDDTRARIDSNSRRAPRFTYGHLLTTHHPFLYDSLGRPRSYRAIAADKSMTAYHNAVRVANRDFLQLVREIRTKGRRRSVIFLISDHGNRMDELPHDDAFRNLVAVYYPDGQPTLPINVSPVNLFRDLFNRYFRQQYPSLPDRSVSVRYK